MKWRVKYLMVITLNCNFFRGNTLSYFTFFLHGALDEDDQEEVSKSAWRSTHKFFTVTSLTFYWFSCCRPKCFFSDTMADFNFDAFLDEFDKTPTALFHNIKLVFQIYFLVLSFSFLVLNFFYLIIFWAVCFKLKEIFKVMHTSIVSMKRLQEIV